MSETLLTWMPALVVMLVGLAAGLYVATLFKKQAQDPADDLDDLESRRDNLIALLRDLEAQKNLLNPDIYTQQKTELEARAITVTQTRDALLAQAPDATRPRFTRADATPTVKFLAAHPQLQGMLWGAGAVIVLALLGYFVTRTPQSQLAGPAMAQPAAAAPLDPQVERELSAVMATLQTDPANVGAYVRGAQILMGARRPSDARPFIDRALQLDPEHADALVAYATYLAAQGDLPGALRTLDNVVKRTPDHLPANYLRGMLAAKLNDPPRMQESLKRFVAAAPEGPQKDEAVALLAGKSTAPKATPANAPTVGRALWEAKCALCHGRMGDADTPMGRAMGIVNMANPSFQARTPDAELERAMQMGINKEEAGMRKRMQAFPELDAAQRRELIQVIRSFAPATP